MAMPIHPTPKLNARETGCFLKRVEEGLKTKAYPVGDPAKLEQARLKVLEYATSRKQNQEPNEETFWRRKPRALAGPR